MKKELLEIAKNNKLKTALGIFAAGLVLSNAEVQVNDYQNLQQKRSQDNSPSNRYKVDYGGKVRWLEDPKTGARWDYMGKNQCLSKSPYSFDNVTESVDSDGILHVRPDNHQRELQFTGIEDVTARLKPADDYTREVIFHHECQVTDY
ncbi:hypothetical protein EBZ57_00705 [bacterium]|nr:hypothetical protein [bacterium]